MLVLLEHVDQKEQQHTKHLIDNFLKYISYIILTCGRTVNKLEYRVRSVTNKKSILFLIIS